MSTVKTPKGTELPLTNLKGKNYLMVAYRIQWMNEEVPSFTISTDVLKMDQDESIVKATITLYDKDGKITKTSQATKREDSKGFADHLEKAETSAIGRALALLGFGTQFALADLDEGNRLADSPLQTAKSVPVGITGDSDAKGTSTITETPKRVSKFKRQSLPTATAVAEMTGDDL